MTDIGEEKKPLYIFIYAGKADGPGRALWDRGFLGANSEALGQYGKLAVEYQLGRFKEIRPGMHEFHLNPTPENEEAVDIAIGLLSSSEQVDLRADRKAQELLRGASLIPQRTLTWRYLLRPFWP